jgi:3',5'-cyclic AMP phosphodiesterase CpdA
MEVTRRHRRVTLLLVAGSFIAGWTGPDVDSVPAAQETLSAVGRRLSRSCSEHDLSVMASRGDLVLGHLDHRERAALGQSYLRFAVDSPVIVDVAVPVMSIPFWIADQGFQRTELTLENADTSWAVYRKSFRSGTIGLGVNGLDRTPAAHYVVFVRRTGDPKSAARSSFLTLDSTRSPAWRMTRARPGVSAANDAHKPFRELPVDLAEAVLIQPAHGARHSTLLATGRTWKTHVVSSRFADQVAIAYGSDASRELVWTWRTSPEVTATAIRVARLSNRVESEPLTNDPESEPGLFRIVKGESAAVEVRNLLNDPSIRRHRVAVNGLEPNTVYRYSLGDGSPEHWRPSQTVKTAPDSSRGARFLYLGDAQTGLGNWGRLLGAAYRRHPDIDFLVLAGDLVDRGNERTNWDHFFLRAAGVFDRVPLMPCVGNHEYLDMGPRLYRAFFELPRNGPDGIDPDLVYHFECGDACFAVLDSTLAVCDPSQARRQAQWLDATLSNSIASWKFVIFHHPVYPSHPWRDTPSLREHWVPIFDKHHVDMVLQGHDHAYLRTYPMRGHERVDSPGQGTIYVIAVSGDKFVDQAPRDYIETGQSRVSTYQTIDIDGPSRRLTYRAWTEGGLMIDELSIDKSSVPRSSRWSTVTSALPSSNHQAGNRRSQP